MPDGSRVSDGSGVPDGAPNLQAAERVGVVLVGHGHTASQLLEAARGVLPPGSLDGVSAVDAGVGQTPQLERLICDVLDTADQGKGVLLLVDLLGSSPCSCGMRNAAEDGHRFAVVSGLNLAMLLKLGILDRGETDLAGLAEACADSGRKSVTTRFK